MEDAALEELASQYMDDFFARFPSAATRAGIHRHDAEMEDFSTASRKAHTAALRAFEEKLLRLDGAAMSPSAAADRDMMVSQIRAWLLEYETLRSWEKNPDYYAGAVSDSAFVLMRRDFAPLRERLAALTSRARRMPGVFENARTNLRNPPRLYTEVALEQLPGTIDFFRRDVPAAFAELRGTPLYAEFESANTGVVRALEGYRAYLEKELLPSSDGDFRIGAEAYRRKLLYEEMIDTPLERLLEIAYRDLRRNQRLYAEVARSIDPGRDPSDILAEMQEDHPEPDRLLDSFRGVLDGLVSFIEDRRIITLPSRVRPRIEETPPFARALSFASLDSPGPFETRATEAFFNVTLPEPGWTPAQVREHMAAFNPGTIVSTAIHEAYPGHFVQYLWDRQVPSRIRRFLGLSSAVTPQFAYANAEGWAHYAEQMMFDEGYAADQPRLRLGQIQDALLRNARFVVGIELHTGKMTFEEGVRFFIEEGRQTPANARREALRGTSDPTYLVYTLGKLQILELREDYRKRMGDRFTLRDFHDTLMKQGSVPLKIIRRAMLGSDSPAL